MTNDQLIKLNTLQDIIKKLNSAIINPEDRHFRISSASISDFEEYHSDYAKELNKVTQKFLDKYKEQFSLIEIIDYNTLNNE